MRTHLIFESKDFPAYPDEAEQTNPDRFGKRLAEFIADALTRAGFVIDCIGGEDWGWIVMTKYKPFSLWIGCGDYKEFENSFLCFIEPSKPFVRKWFSKVDTTVAVEKVAVALETALVQSGKVSNLRWLPESEVKW